MMQSCFKSLKCEEVKSREYGTPENVVARFPYFIEEVCNQKRLHLALGYLSPNEVEETLLNQENYNIPRRTLLTLSVQS